MANISNDPYRPTDAPYRSPYADDAHDAAPLDNDLQADPELAGGGGKVAMITVAVALVLGAVFYGLNRSSIDQAGTSATAQNTAQNNAETDTAQNKNSAPLTAPPGMRDVTPRANSEAGVTTGSATGNPFNHGEQR